MKKRRSHHIHIQKKACFALNTFPILSLGAQLTVWMYLSLLAKFRWYMRERRRGGVRA